MAGFRAPSSVRARHFEFPAGSGLNAGYWPEELAIMHALVARLRAARDAGDHEEAARVRAEAEFIHELKAVFPGSVLRDA